MWHVAKFGSVLHVAMLVQPINVMCWNVRGLNCPDRRANVSATIATSSFHIVCLPETKLDAVDTFTVAFLGGNRLRNYAQRPADGTRGGMLMLWDDHLVEMSNITASTFCLSAMVRIRESEVQYKLTTVYGPSASSRKDAFFAELISQKPPNGMSWLVAGDFNQIYRARDKNKRHVNRSRINRFRTTLQSCDLKEIKFQNRRLT